VARGAPTQEGVSGSSAAALLEEQLRSAVSPRRTLARRLLPATLEELPMKLTRISHVLPVVAVAVTLGSVAQASPEGVSEGQVAAATSRLEKAFSDQFVQGNIDRGALTGAIDDVLQAMPETARAGALEHIDSVIATGQKLAAEMTPEQRAEVAKPPSPEQQGQLKQYVTGWGWPGYGGFGAFGYPYGAWGGGWGWGTGYGTGTSCINGFCTGY
jgi:hypothetical protein